MKLFRNCLAVLFSLLAGVEPAAGDAVAGKALYAPCAACHGDQGQGNPLLDSPAVAGQDPAYLTRQLEQFRSGVRGSDPADVPGGQMRAMAATLSSEATVADVVAYIETLSGAGGAARAPVPYDRRNGENQYNAACGACHGRRAEGNPRLHSPRLAGLDAAYLRRQYRNFASGVRGSDPNDQYGRQMQMMSTMLATEQDLEDVIGFILAQ